MDRLVPRLHLFELEDMAWFPAWIRDLGTDYIHFVEHRFALHEPVVPLLRDALAASGVDRVVDLCSGGSGPVPALARDLAAAGMQVHFTLTDRFPNLAAFRRAAATSDGAIAFEREPVDAREVPSRLAGLRTLFNSFHHFRPAEARAILEAAVDAGQPIAVFEIPDRRIRSILPLLLTPLFVWFFTPVMRPFRWRRLLLTYVLPVVPLYCLWDGVVSQLRAYSVPELEELSRGLGGDGYVWRAGHAPLEPIPGRVTWLIGVPR